MNELQKGDSLEDGSLVVLDVDRLCYQVLSQTNSARGVRTISKALLTEWIAAVRECPQKSPMELRAMLRGKTDVDKYEYGYFSTLKKMAEMVLGLTTIVHAPDALLQVQRPNESGMSVDEGQVAIGDFPAFVRQVEDDAKTIGLCYAPDIVRRFLCAQLAKPFVVLTGLSGSGKTKLAATFTEWLDAGDMACIVPVGADWTNNEKLLGYPNALDPEKYVLPDTGVLKLMLDARDNPTLPFFLILDEMNLSHVERYFADFLSTMESEEEIRLYDGKDRVADDGTQVPQRLKFPRNLFVIGTMNVDETTYMFSPKVLDRAQVIEFRVSAKEMMDFLSSPTCPNLAAIAGKGAKYAEAFLRIALERKCKKPGEDELKAVKEALGAFFPELAKLGAEFGYRSAMEIVTFVAYYLDAAGYDQMPAGTEKAKVLNAAIDAAILQKLLPKLHGSLNRLGPVLDALIGKASKKIPVANDPDAEPEVKVIYKLTYEKLCRMKERVEKNGFTSFAEA